MAYRLDIYSLESSEVFANEEAADEEMDYQSRVMERLCRVRQVDDGELDD